MELNGKQIMLAGLKGEKGDKGDGLDIKKYYTDGDEMVADYDNPDIAVGDCVALVENGFITLYLKKETAFAFYGNLTGEKGEQGNTGVTGAGVFGFKIENGTLILYSEDVGAVNSDYEITPQGDLTVTIN